MINALLISSEEGWTPRYNIAPTQPVPVVRQHPKEPVRESSKLRSLLQFRVFRFGFLQNGDIGVSVFPEGEEVLVGDAGLGAVSRQRVGAGQT